MNKDRLRKAIKYALIKVDYDLEKVPLKDIVDSQIKLQRQILQFRQQK